MPYKLRKAPKKELYWVITKETGKKHEKDPIPLEKAKAQMRILESVLKGEGKVAQKKLLDLKTKYIQVLQQLKQEHQKMINYAIAEDIETMDTLDLPISNKYKRLNSLKTKIEEEHKKWISIERKEAQDSIPEAEDEEENEPSEAASSGLSAARMLRKGKGKHGGVFAKTWPMLKQSISDLMQSPEILQSLTKKSDLIAYVDKLLLEMNPLIDEKGENPKLRKKALDYISLFFPAYYSQEVENLKEFLTEKGKKSVGEITGYLPHHENQPPVFRTKLFPKNKLVDLRTNIHEVHSSYTKDQTKTPFPTEASNELEEFNKEQHQQILKNLRKLKESKGQGKHGGVCKPPYHEYSKGKASAFVLTCIDPRYTFDVAFYLQHKKELHQDYDLFTLAGASVGAAKKEWTKSFMDNLELGMKLHGITEVWCFDHLDCGMYKATFGLEKDLDPKIHIDCMDKLKAIIHKKHPELKFREFMVDVKGHVHNVKN